MTISNNSIADVSRGLRSQSDLPLWAIASSSTLSAIALGVPEAFGPRGRWIKTLFATTGLSCFGLQSLRLLTFGMVTFWWAKSFKRPRHKKTPIELFVGFGAGPEQQMFQAFLNESERHVEHLDQTKPATFSTVVRPSIRSLWRHAWNEPQLIFNGLRRSDSLVINAHKHEWLTSIAIRIGTYVFYKSWAEKLPKDIRRIIFVSADIPAFAVIDAQKLNSDLIVEFRQHGFLRKSVVLPKFNKVLALNEPEAEHIKLTTGCERAETVAIRYEEHSIEKQSILMFASIYDIPDFKKGEHLVLIRGVVDWATNNHLRVVIRLHPREEKGFWTTHFPALEVERGGDQFEECVKRLAPKIVMSWFSTALIDALKVGVLPVLITQGSEKTLADMVFPLDEIAVKWPEEKANLESLINEPDHYHGLLVTLQKRTFGLEADELASK